MSRKLKISLIQLLNQDVRPRNLVNTRTKCTMYLSGKSTKIFLNLIINTNLVLNFLIRLIQFQTFSHMYQFNLFNQFRLEIADMNIFNNILNIMNILFFFFFSYNFFLFPPSFWLARACSPIAGEASKALGEGQRKIEGKKKEKIIRKEKRNSKEISNHFLKKCSRHHRSSYMA